MEILVWRCQTAASLIIYYILSDRDWEGSVYASSRCRYFWICIHNREIRIHLLRKWKYIMNETLHQMRKVYWTSRKTGYGGDATTREFPAESFPISDSSRCMFNLNRKFITVFILISLRHEIIHDSHRMYNSILPFHETFQRVQRAVKAFFMIQHHSRSSTVHAVQPSMAFIAEVGLALQTRWPRLGWKDQ